jgi:hypothetical protein
MCNINTLYPVLPLKAGKAGKIEGVTPYLKPTLYRLLTPKIRCQDRDLPAEKLTKPPNILKANIRTMKEHKIGSRVLFSRFNKYLQPQIPTFTIYKGWA